LFAAFNIADGTVIGELHRQRRAGWLVSRHRQQTATISVLARQAEREHQMQTRRALLDERARIAGGCTT